MKKILIVTMALVLVLGASVTALAAGTGTRSETKVQLTEEQREDLQARRVDLFETYFQDGLEEFLVLKEEHKTFHEGAQADREAFKEAVKASFEAIKAAVENGDITKRDGQVKLIELRIEVRNMRNEMDLVRLDKIAAQAAGKDRMIEVREEVKTLLAEEPVDSDAVALLLSESLGILRLHIDSDVYYHGLMIEIAESY